MYAAVHVDSIMMSLLVHLGYSSQTVEKDELAYTYILFPLFYIL